MSKINLETINSRLIEIFDMYDTKIVFWYDENADFEDSIEDLAIDGVEILKLYTNNQFITKYILEVEKQGEKILIYAPIEEPKIEDNHLADMLLYSKKFKANKIDMILNDIGLDSAFSYIIEAHIKFFDSKDRRKKFRELLGNNQNEREIYNSLFAVTLGINSKNIDDIILSSIKSTLDESSQFVNSLKNYSLEELLYKHINELYGCNINTFDQFIKILFMTNLKSQSNYVTKNVSTELILEKSNMLENLFDKFKNIRNIDETYNNISQDVYKQVRNNISFDSFDEITKCDIFKNFDEAIIKNCAMMLEKDCDYNKLLNQILERKNMFFINSYIKQYEVIINVLKFYIEVNLFSEKDNFISIIDSYCEKDYQIDYYYRKVIYYYDKLKQHDGFKNIVNNINNIYATKFLNPLNIKFTKTLDYNKIEINDLKMNNFYKNYVENKRSKQVVIISDAFRYEVAQELVTNLRPQSKYNVDLKYQIALLPSITKTGMANLLPHKSITTSNYKIEEIKVDGINSEGLDNRKKILKATDDNYDAIRYKDYITLRREDKRELLKAKVLYLYHNKIDAVGDKRDTENNVFNACNESLEELNNLISDIMSNGVSNIIITADHGFIYTRYDSNKIELDKENNKAKSRYILSDKPIEEYGVEIFDNKISDAGYVITPNTVGTFKVGEGNNYFHGGSSLQETLCPVMDIGLNKGKNEISKVEVKLISMPKVLTSMTNTFEIFQNLPVNEDNIAEKFNLYIVDKSNNKVTRSYEINANIESVNANDRQILCTVDLLNNIEYNSNDVYTLIIENSSNNIIIHHELKISVFSTDDFGF